MEKDEIDFFIHPNSKVNIIKNSIQIFHSSINFNTVDAIFDIRARGVVSLWKPRLL